ncbi:MAG: hypothetical protein KGZ42_09045 [Melioribacter sp.]|nr:hypothetical protein [Melioribacter sp.]
MKFYLSFLIVIFTFLISCNDNEKTNSENANSQLDAAIQFQTSLISELSQKFKVDTLGGSLNIRNSFMQFGINDYTYDHSNTYNYSLQVYLKWKENYSRYKIRVLFQGSNHFSFELKDDYTVTTVDVISYTMKNQNLIEFNIRSVSLNI